MKSTNLEFWNQKGSIYHSIDGKYEAIKLKDGTYKCWRLEDHKCVGIFYNDDILNDYLGYVLNGSSSFSVGAKGFGRF